jgi:large subunit ribosomal protein L23
MERDKLLAAIQSIKCSLLTEKTLGLYKDKNLYSFLVYRHLNKKEIKAALQELFEIRIKKINTCLLPIKFRKINNLKGRRPNYKKAYVTLDKKSKILNFFN